MTEPLRYPDPPDVRQRRADRYLNERDEKASEQDRARFAAQDAQRGPQEARDGASEAVRVFGHQQRTEGRRGPG